MRNLCFWIFSIVIGITIMSGCNKIEETTTDNNNTSMLYDAEFIMNKYQDGKSGYIQITGDKVAFKEAIFDYDDKAIMFVKEYMDEDFIEYDLSNAPEIFMIEFEDFTTKYKKVDYEFLSDNFKNYSSRPFYVEIIDNKISSIIEIYVP